MGHSIITETDVSEDGLLRLRLQNDRLRVSVLPTSGGKISEILDLKTGRNWLWRNPHLAVRANTNDADYDKELDSGGWDEILFSVSPATIDLNGSGSVVIPDHGDVVGRDWTVDSHGGEERGASYCRMSVHGRALDYRLQRTLTLEPGSAALLIDYSLDVFGDTALPWYWCAHPLIAVEAGMRIELPDGQPFRLANGPPGEVEQHWPDLKVAGRDSVDLSRAYDGELQDGATVTKAFVESPTDASVTVCGINPNEFLKLTYSAEQFPWLGLWINNRAWSGCGSEPYLNLGLEPSTSRYDNVADAIDEAAIEWISPGESRHWSLTVEISS